MDIINIDEALKLLDGEKLLLKKLLESFVNDKKFDVNYLNQLIEKNWEEAASYVHYYKGAGRQLACKKLAHSGQELEDILRKRTEGNLQEKIKIFQEDYIETLNKIQEILFIL